MDFKKIEVEQLKNADKKAFSCLFGRLATVAVNTSVDVPVMATSDGKNVLTAEQISRIFYALNKSFDFTLEISEIEQTSKDAEKFVIFSIKKTDKKTTVKTVEPVTSDLKRESSKKTTARSEQKKETAKKEADDLNKTCKMKILTSIEKIAPSYAAFKSEKLADFMKAIEKILNENF